jgi:hypothetical protein
MIFVLWLLFTGLVTWGGVSVFARKNRPAWIGGLIGFLAAAFITPLGGAVVLALMALFVPKQNLYGQREIHGQFVPPRTHSSYPQPTMQPAHLNQPSSPLSHDVVRAIPSQPLPPAAQTNGDKAQRLREAKLLMDEGLISSAEFEQMKAQILNS